MMESINWNKVYKLSPGEFSENPNSCAEPALMYALGGLRQFLNVRMFPSPVKGALARFTGKTTGQHYAVDRLSTASDMFIEGTPFDIYSKILHSNLFTGIGIYLDTNGPDGKPWVMFHLDIRERDYPFIWICQKMYDQKKKRISNHYIYPSHSKYWSLFNDSKLYTYKQYGH